MTLLTDFISTTIPFAQSSISFFEIHARSLLGFAILLVSIHVFKPLLTGLVRALLITISPKLNREQRLANQNWRKMLAMRRVTREVENISPNMAAELRALAARG